MSIASAMKAELLTNGRCRPAELRQQIGCGKESIWRVARQLIAAGLVETVQERGENGRRMDACVVLDWDGLAAWETPGSCGCAMYRWDGLMRAFGVNLRNIRGLPTTLHVSPWAEAA